MGCSHERAAANIFLYIVRDSTWGSVDLLNLWSNTEGPVDPDHHLLLKINDQLIMDQTWDGKGGQQFSATIPLGILVKGENRLLVGIPGDTGSEAEVVWINWYEVSYPRYAVAEEEQLKYTVG